MDEYYCPHCGATLNNQPGFDPSSGTWTCESCGKLLMDDDVYDGDSYEGVAWYCDNCGSLLNRQSGFSDSYGLWRCTECGHTNGTSDDDIYESQERYERQKKANEWSDIISSAITSALFHSDDDDSNGNADKLTCPNCDEVLNDQLCFNEYADEWVCTECGAHLRHSYSDGPYSIVDDESSDTYDDGRRHTYTSSESGPSIRYDASYTSFKKKSFFRQHCKGTFVAVLSLIVIVSVAVGYWQYQKLMPIGYNAESLVGRHYESVLIDLQEAGFTNVHIESFEDLDIADVDKENQVFQVEVRGDTDFDEEAKYPYDTRITIKYHAIKLILPPMSHKDAKGMNYEEVVSAFEDAGFVNIQTEAEYDVILGWFTKDGEVKRVTIAGEKGYKITTEIRPDVEVLIIYHTLKSNAPE